MEKLFKDKDFYKRLGKLAMPIALQALLLSFVGASDTIMLGNLDQNSMSAVSLATQIQFVQNLILMGVVSAFLILGAQYFGKNDKQTVDKLFFMQFRIAVIASIFVAAACLAFPSFLMRLYTNEEVLIEIGTKYLRIAAFSYLMTGFSQCFLALVKLNNRASSAATISGVTVVLNIGLNAIFIFGLLGSPAMGAEGAALATTISRFVELVMSFICVIKDKQMRPSVAYIFTVDKNLRIDFNKQLVPLMGAQLIWTLGMTSYSAFMGHISIDAAASNSVIIVVRNLVHSFAQGLASGGSILVGMVLGTGNLDKAKLYGFRLSVLSLFCGAFTASVSLLLTGPAIRFIKLSDGAVSIFKEMIIIQAIYMIACSFNSVVINGIFAAGGDTTYDFYSLAVVMWGVAVPLAALGTFVFHWPAALVFACTCLDEAGKIPWTIHHYRKYKWLKDLTR